MHKKNSIFIATSLDGYIADQNGGIDWLHAIPNPDQIEMGYGDFTARIDALVMGALLLKRSVDLTWIGLTTKIAGSR